MGQGIFSPERNTGVGKTHKSVIKSRHDIWLIFPIPRARHRLQKFLLRQGRVYRETKGWSVKHRAWILTQRFNHPAMQQTFEAYLRSVEETENRLRVLNQQVDDLSTQEPYQTRVRYLRCLKGIDTLTAMTLLVEIQDFRRFTTASALMGFTGLTPSEHSSGPKVWRGSITKSGNAHVRRVLVESAWCSRNADIVSQALAEAASGMSARSHQNCTQSTDPVASHLLAAGESSKSAADCRDCSGPRINGICVGDQSAFSQNLVLPP